MSLMSTVDKISLRYSKKLKEYETWISNVVSKEKFILSQLPVINAVEHFPCALAATLSKMPKIAHRFSLAENIWEEHGNGLSDDSHVSTFLEYLFELNNPMIVMHNLDSVTATNSYNESIRNFCLANSAEEGAALLGMIEHEYAKISGLIAKVITEKKWVSPGSQRHYSNHEVLDIQHAKELFEWPEKCWGNPGSKERIERAMDLGAHYLYRLYFDLIADASETFAMGIDTGINFAHVREDFAVERAAIELRAVDGPVSVLMIGSGGCSVIQAAAMKEVERVTVIDANINQGYLISMKIAAYQYLSTEDIVTLFGYGYGSAQDRIDIYDQQLKEHLTKPVSRYVTNHPQVLTLGLDQCGRFEGLFKDLRTELKNAGDLVDESDTYESVFKRSYLSDLLGPASVDYSMSNEFSEHFFDVISKEKRKASAAGSEMPGAINPFLSRVLSEPSCVELTQKMTEKVKVIKSAIEDIGPNLFKGKITFSVSRMDYFLDNNQNNPTAGDNWDVIHISNIMDWLPFDEAKKLLEVANAGLSPSGLVVARRLNGDYVLHDTMSAVLDTDTEQNSKFKALESAFFYNEVCVGVKK